MTQKTTFVPQLIIGHGVTDISFYTEAFGAKELQRWSNDDGSIHVAELEIDGAMFHLHEEVTRNNSISPASASGTTVIVGLMVDDVHAVFDRAVAAGAKAISPVTDYDYRYRQGDVMDPFGHHWLIEKILK
ncbi:VOC family protein [Mucilaginibacter sp. McL0603]|uniref:VOC family protein n=1 Tax=Mucilaginibacter sp. McL0603 TaxID=3415670 RepID=UPI003CFACDB4